MAIGPEHGSTLLPFPGPKVLPFGTKAPPVLPISGPCFQNPGIQFHPWSISPMSIPDFQILTLASAVQRRCPMNLWKKKILELPKNFLDIPKNFLDIPKNFLEFPKKFLEIPRNS